MTSHPDDIYVIYSRSGKVILVISKTLVRLNPELAENIIPKPLNPEELAKFKLPTQSPQYGAINSRIQSGEIAWICYPAKIDLLETVFSLRDGILHVEKRILANNHSNRSSPFSQVGVPPTPISVGTKFSEKLTLALHGMDDESVSKELKSFIGIVVNTFTISKDGKLPENAVDAIPRNCIIQKDGTPVFFDLEYELAGGVSLSFIIFRTIKADITPYLPKSEKQKAHQDLYTKLCTDFGITPQFNQDQRLSKALKRFITGGFSRTTRKVLISLIPVVKWRKRLLNSDCEPASPREFARFCRLPTPRSK